MGDSCDPMGETYCACSLICQFDRKRFSVRYPHSIGLLENESSGLSEQSGARKEAFFLAGGSPAPVILHARKTLWNSKMIDIRPL